MKDLILIWCSLFDHWSCNKLVHTHSYTKCGSLTHLSNKSWLEFSVHLIRFKVMFVCRWRKNFKHPNPDFYFSRLRVCLGSRTSLTRKEANFRLNWTTLEVSWKKFQKLKFVKQFMFSSATNELMRAEQDINQLTLWSRVHRLQGKHQNVTLLFPVKPVSSISFKQLLLPTQMTFLTLLTTA